MPKLFGPQSNILLAGYYSLAINVKTEDEMSSLERKHGHPSHASSFKDTSRKVGFCQCRNRKKKKTESFGSLFDVDNERV